MFGIIDGIPKPSLMFKCEDCGHKFKLLFAVLTKKCPRCDSENIKPTIGQEEINGIKFPGPVN